MAALQWYRYLKHVVAVPGWRATSLQAQAHIFKNPSTPAYCLDMATQTLEVNGRSISLPTGLFIGGKFVKAKAGKTFGVENPATGKEIIQVQEGLPEDVDDAVKVARKLFRSKEYEEYGATNRAKLLHKLADLMEENFDDLVALEMLDTGKTHLQASTLDVPGSIGTLRYYAGWADKILGQTSFDIPKVFGYTKREPVGVCGQIIPWNVGVHKC